MKIAQSCGEFTDQLQAGHLEGVVSQCGVCSRVRSPGQQGSYGNASMNTPGNSNSEFTMYEMFVHVHVSIPVGVCTYT